MSGRARLSLATVLLSTRVVTRALLSALLLVAVLLQGACATGGGVPAGMSGLRVESNVPEASVLIDDRLVGRVTDLSGAGRRLPAGFHRVEVRHPGRYSFFQEIEMRSGDEIVIKAHLRELIQ